VATVTTPIAISDEVPAAAPEAHDEALLPDGLPRPLYAGLLGQLEGADLRAIAAEIAAYVREHSIAFRAGGELVPFGLDAVPRLIERSEWVALEAGVRQRVRALHAFVGDVYGDRAIVAAGRIPARVIDGADHLEPDLLGVEQPRVPTGIAGLDIVRGADGHLGVLEDNYRTPSGLSYAAAARVGLDAALPLTPPPDRLPMDAGADLLAGVLTMAAPDAAGDAGVAVLTDGPENSAWFEHRDLSSRLGIPLVTRRDLHREGDRLYAWVDDGRARELRVVYRRTDEDRLRDDDGRPTWIAEALLEPVRKGTLAVVNPLGCGVADDKLVHAYVEEMIRFYLGEEPLLASVPTYDLGDSDQLATALERLDDLVVKPRSGYGGEGVVVCRHANAEDRRRVAQAVRDDPGAFIAQETVTLSTHPTEIDGVLEPRHVDLRVFAIGDQVVAGGLTRYAKARDALVVNSSQGGGAKDTWVVG
jgi:carboxylate-amine ligase